ncbi:MAG: methyl-accepting chemotaxis protein [Zoogloeaceae bacterium]|nr:methyl-accepting chemotaxis protein [Zoogloeaceae bacterium]
MTLAPDYGRSSQKKKKRAKAKSGESSETSVAQRIQSLGVFVAVLLIMIGVLIFIENRGYVQGTAYVSAAGDLRMLSQRLAKSSSLALQGDANSFAQLQEASSRFSELLEILEQGGLVGSVRVDASPDNVREKLSAITEHWARLKKSATTLTEQSEPLVALSKSVASINEGNARLQELGEHLTSLQLSEAGARQISAASQIWMLTQSIAKNANTILTSSIINPEAALNLHRDTDRFKGLLAEMGSGGSAETRKTLQSLEQIFSVYQDSVGSILTSLHALEQAKQSGANIFLESDTLFSEADDLYQAYQNNLSIRSWFIFGIVGLTALMIALLIWIANIYLKETHRRAEESELQRQASESTNRQNQEAILRLMNELGDLADGDLTVTATVSEDITGAIADSINYTIEELRVLVRRINDAATRVTQSTEIARKTSMELLAAAEKQGSEINMAGSSALTMADSMKAVSSHASQSAQVARSSLEAADKGTSAVQDSIRSMNEIRENIQETSKRIKRLGESSQEIGEIVELISDITEQTNVLALNAAIQAASAGEAGRGFTVVAEEVQRLAERSAEATKQISALVKTIQTDTQDAVSAMEQSTQGVVEGARRSDAAGQALAEIGQVSRDLAALIENISSATQQQAQSATQVANLMQDILRITKQTTVSTNHTAETVEQLSALAAELKGSVAGFKVN